METPTNEHAKAALIAQLEDAIGYKLETPKHFEAMREMIFRRTHQIISPTTLRRIWGYNSDLTNTRSSTFSIMARALGYKDWKDFVSYLSSDKQASTDIPSSPVLTRSIDVKSTLEPGDIVKLFWQPNRQCTIKYLGMMRFEIIETHNTRLQPGDTFSCHLIVAGQPLFLSSLIHDNSQPMAYICGKLHGGIQFEFCPE